MHFLHVYLPNAHSEIRGTKNSNGHSQICRTASLSVEAVGFDWFPDKCAENIGYVGQIEEKVQQYRVTFKIKEMFGI